MGEVTAGRDRLLAADAAEQHVGEVCSEVVAAFHGVASFRWCAVMTTDPRTLLPSGGAVEGFDRAACAPFWDNELLDPDFDKFVDLARRIDPVATLYESVDGDLARSPRYQKLYAALGVADELRVAFTAGSTCIAVGTFVRPAEEGPYSTGEVADVRALVPVATNAMRRALGRVRNDGPGQPVAVVILGPGGEVVSMSVGAQHVLDDLRVDVDGDLPGTLLVAAQRARWGRTPTTLVTHLRGRSGRCVRLQVAPMEGDAGTVALTIETARPDDLGRILLESYGLTERETEVVLHLCRGASTKEIAAELLISAHTVRDHVKAIFDKAGVNSRGELVASLFANHVLERFEEEVAHV